VINASQQVLARDVIIEVEQVEKFVLFAAQLTHHDESLPSIDVFQDTEQSTRRQTFSTQSGREQTTERALDWSTNVASWAGAVSSNGHTRLKLGKAVIGSTRPLTGRLAFPKVVI
jgi:hypothetical protein